MVIRGFSTNGRFDSGDLVDALANGGYEQGPRAAVSVVPEPTSFTMLTMVLLPMGKLKWCRKPVGTVFEF